MNPIDSSIESYINSICSQIQCVEVHEDIRQELLAHIHGHFEELTSKGLNEKEAIVQVLNQMGDPQEIGRGLHQIHRPRVEWRLLILLLLMSTIGIITMAFLEYLPSQDQWIFTETGIVKNTLWSYGLGLPLAIGLFFFDYRKLKPLSPYLLGFGIYYMILIFFQVDLPFHNFNSLIDLGPFTLDPLTILPGLFITALAGIFANWNWQKNATYVKAFFLWLIPSIFFIPFGFNALVPAFFFYMGFTVLIFSAAPNSFHRWLPVILSSLFIGVIALFAITGKAYILDRFLSFWNPYADPAGYGYQIIQAQKAMINTGFWGHGLASLPHIPAMSSSMILPLLIYILGWGGGIAILYLLFTFLLRSIRAIQAIKDPYGALLSKSLIALLLLPLLYNPLYAFGFVPAVGIPVPFLSYNPGETLFQLLILGLILGIYRRKDITSQLSRPKSNPQEASQ